MAKQKADDETANSTIKEFVVGLRHRPRYFKVEVRSRTAKLVKYEAKRARIDETRPHATHTLRLKERRQMTPRLEAERRKQ